MTQIRVKCFKKSNKINDTDMNLLNWVELTDEIYPTYITAVCKTHFNQFLNEDCDYFMYFEIDPLSYIYLS